MTLTFGSLFAGVGGFDMGFEQAGFDCKFQVEWDKNCQQILNKHWPDVPKWLDVSDVNGAEIPPVDCIIFGSPCQDLSVAGARRGLSGERSGLFHEAVRIIREMKDATNGTFPRWTVWENVAGALSSNNGRDFGTVINEMAKAGAHLQEYALLDAQYFGVPQRRRRVFLVSCFDPATSQRCPDPLLPVTESLRGDSKKGKQKGKEPASQIAESFGSDGQWAAGSTEGGDILRTSVTSKWYKGSAGPSGSEYYNMVVEDQPILIDRAAFNQGENAAYEPYISDEPVIPSLVARGPHAVFTKSKRAQSTSDNETWVEGEVNPTLNSFDVGDTRATTAIVEPVLFENSYRDGARIAKEGVTQTLSAKMGTGGGNTPMIAVAYSIREDAKANTFSATELDHANALSALRPSPQSHHAQMFIAQPMAVRRLTPIECEKLQGWPVDHTRWKVDGTEMADSNRYKMIGNGVATPVAKWIAQHIAKVEYAEG
jgi:DNA (cytosine-5)-methyltransferase 1